MIRFKDFRPIAYRNERLCGYDLIDPDGGGRYFVSDAHVLSIPIPEAGVIIDHFLRSGERLDPLIACALDARDYAAAVEKFAPEKDDETGCGVSFFNISIKDLAL